MLSIGNINSFIQPLGIRVSTPKQVLAKVTTVALAAIFIVSNLSAVSAGPLLLACMNKCPGQAPDPAYSACVQRCYSAHCPQGGVCS